MEFILIEGFFLVWGVYIKWFVGKFVVISYVEWFDKSLNRGIFRFEIIEGFVDGVVCRIK